MNEGRRVVLIVSLGDWLVVDGEMDNTVALNSSGTGDAEDPALADRARGVREAGWRVTGPLLEPLVTAGTWPPGGELLERQVPVALPVADWRMAIARLRRHDVDDDLARRLEAALGDAP